MRLTSSNYISTYVPLLSVINQNGKRGLVCRLMMSRTSAAQYGPHRQIIADDERSLYTATIGSTIFLKYFDRGIILRIYSCTYLDLLGDPDLDRDLDLERDSDLDLDLEMRRLERIGGGDLDRD